MFDFYRKKITVRSTLTFIYRHSRPSLKTKTKKKHTQNNQNQSILYFFSATELGDEEFDQKSQKCSLFLLFLLSFFCWSKCLQAKRRTYKEKSEGKTKENKTVHKEKQLITEWHYFFINIRVDVFQLRSVSFCRIWLKEIMIANNFLFLSYANKMQTVKHTIQLHTYKQKMYYRLTRAIHSQQCNLFKYLFLMHIRSISIVYFSTTKIQASISLDKYRIEGYFFLI